MSPGFLSLAKGTFSCKSIVDPGILLFYPCESLFSTAGASFVGPAYSFLTAPIFIPCTSRKIALNLRLSQALNHFKS